VFGIVVVPIQKKEPEAFKKPSQSALRFRQFLALLRSPVVRVLAQFFFGQPVGFPLFERPCPLLKVVSMTRRFLKVG